MKRILYNKVNEWMLLFLRKVELQSTSVSDVENLNPALQKDVFIDWVL